jgi:hypothetical protein
MQAIRLAVVMHGSLQVCNQFTPFLFRVKFLGFETTQSLSGQGDMPGEQWLKLVRSFNCAIYFRMAGELTNDILHALPPTKGDHTTVHPALRYLFVETPRMVNELSWGALLLLVITSRSLSGRHVCVELPLFQCHICHFLFRHQNEYEHHLIGDYARRTLCSNCSLARKCIDFRLSFCTPFPS